MIPLLSLVIGIALIALGLVGYVASGMVSWTALIPSFFGVPLAALGLLGRNERARKHAMHGAAILALLGLLGTARGAVSFGKLVGGMEIERPTAAISQTIMAVLCVIFLVVCVRSFVQARRKPAAA